MLRYVVSNAPLGDFSPCGVHFKLWPAILAAGIQATNSALGSYVNGQNQKAANETNLQAVREQNRANMDIARENNFTSMQQFNGNMRWLQEQFYKQREFELENREYEDPKNIVARLKRAGINPAYYFEGANGSASSSVSPVGSPAQSQLSTPHLEAGHVDPVNYDFTGISEAVGHSVNAFYENQLKNQLIQGKKYENQIALITATNEYARQLNDLRKQSIEIDNLLKSGKLSDAEREKVEADKKSIDQQIEFQRENWDELKRSVKVGNDFTVEQTESSKQKTIRENAMAKMDLALRPALARANIRLSQANIQKINAEMPYIFNQSFLAYQQGRKVSSETVGQDIENLLKQIIAGKESHYAGSVQNGHFFGIPLTDIQEASRYLGNLLFGELKGLLK